MFITKNRLMKIIINLLSFTFLPLLSFAQLGQGLSNYSVSGRDYEVTTPENYDKTKEYPIVFELHSLGKDKHQMHHQSLINKQQYISVRPEGKKVLFVGCVWNTWSETNGITGGADDVSYITAVYNDVKAKVGTVFNSEKVYVYGYSNGGAMAMKMVEKTSLFKAIIVRSMSFKKGHNIPSGASKIPMIFVHGTADETVPYNGGKGQYGIVAPKFESVKTTVGKWAKHCGFTFAQAEEVKFLKGSSKKSDKNFYFRQYMHKDYPIYFFAIEGGGHGTNKQFSNSNIKRALLRLIKSPKCYGLTRGLNYCKN